MERADSTLMEQLRPLEGCCGADELARLRAVLARVEGQGPLAAELDAAVRRAAQSLPLVAQAIESSPRALSIQRMGTRERDPDTLVEKLCQSDHSCLDFSMPTRAVLGRAFVLAKLNFLKAMEYLLQEAGEEFRDCADSLGEVIGEVVFSKLAEELLCALIANQFNPMELRRAAARKLLLMWDERLTLPVAELPMLLLSAWRARMKIRAVYGSLGGVREVVSLLQADCEPAFIRHFSRDHVTTDECEAFEEFLFALPYEDLCQIRSHMVEHGLRVVSKEQVREIIGSSWHPALFGEPNPEQMYHSYWRRRIRAEYRVISANPGPRKTAEGYIMEFLLREEIS